MVKPRHVLDEVRRRRGRAGGAGDPITFYWVAITPQDDGGDRNRFRQSLRDAAGDYPLVPVVLRVPGFVDPNAVMNDLGAVLKDCESDLRAPDIRERLARHGFVDFVLIARREFALAATSSPLQVPEWFPVSAGQEVTARIEDLTWSAGVALSAPEAHAGEIKRLLYELDHVLLDRVREVGMADHRTVRGLLDRIQRGGADSVSLGDFLSKAQAALDQVRNPLDYRPSARSGTMVGGLWSHTARTHPDGLTKVAGALAKALQVGDLGIEGHEESIMAVLGRPANPMGDAGQRWAFDVIVTVRAACQFVTAAAHADAYARYPVRLVGSLSRELQRSLDGFVEVVGGIG